MAVVSRAGLDEQRADAVAIATEILVAALRDDHFVARPENAAQPVSILVQPAPEALVGDVDERDQPACRDQRGHLVPLLVVQVGAGRIVAAAMEQHDVAGLGLGQCGAHRVEPHRAAGAIVIGIFDQIEPDRVDDRRMVGPGRRSDQHPRIGIERAISSNPSRSAPQPPGVCNTDDALVVGMFAEQDRAQQFGEALVAGAAEIGFGFLRLDQPLLGRLHHLEDRGAALAIAEHADPDVDLVWPRIGIAKRNQREQRIGFDGREIGEARRLPFGFAQHGVSD